MALARDLTVTYEPQIRFLNLWLVAFVAWRIRLLMTRARSWTPWTVKLIIPSGRSIYLRNPCGLS